MAYGLKYFISYKRKSGGITNIHIEEKDYSDASTNLIAQADPLEIAFDGDPKDIFKPTVGSGATIKVISEPLQLVDVFTDDPQKYRVRIYDGTTMTWQGFVDQHIYSEDLVSKKSQITITANDGMTLLESIPYSYDESTLYTDVSTLGNVIMNIFNKTGLEINAIYKSSDFRVYAYENMFAYAKAINANFYDENERPMNCREVLDTILRPFSLTLKIRGRSLYLIDPISLAYSDRGDVYGVTPPFTSTPNTTFGGYLEVTMPSWRNDIHLDIVPKQTKIEVNYDPYAFTNETFDFNNVNNWSDAGSWDASSSGSYNYYVNDDVRFLGWESSVNSGGTWIDINGSRGLKSSQFSEPTYFIRLQNIDQPFGLKYGYFKYTFPNSFIIGDPSNLDLRLSFDAYVSTIDEIPYVGGTSYDIWYVDLSVGISISDQWYGTNWSTSKVYSSFRIIQPGVYPYYDSKVNDTWTNCSIQIPLNNDNLYLPPPLIGSLTIEILDKFTGIYPAYNSGYIDDIKIKNVKFDVVDSNTGAVIANNSKKYIGTPSTPFSIGSGTTINTKQGSHLAGVPARAVLLYADSSLYIPNTKIGRPMPGLTMGDTGGAGDASAVDTNELIIQSYLSQYSTPKYLVTGTFCSSTKLMGSELYIIKDTPRWGDKAFFMVSGKFNDRNETMNATLIECTSTRI